MLTALIVVGVLGVVAILWGLRCLMDDPCSVFGHRFRFNNVHLLSGWNPWRVVGSFLHWIVCDKTPLVFPDRRWYYTDDMQDPTVVATRQSLMVIEALART